MYGERRQTRRYGIQGLLQNPGRGPQCDAGRDQAPLSQARAQIPPRREQGEGRRGQVQRGRRGLRGMERPGEARCLRSARQQLEGRAGLPSAARLGCGLRVQRRRFHGRRRLRLQQLLRESVRTRLRRRALTRKAYELSFLDALRDAHVQAAFARVHAALHIDLRRPQRDGAARTVKGIFEIDDDLRRVILPLRMKRRAPTAAMRAAEAASEQTLEEVAEVGGDAARETAAAELEARIPIGRRTEVLPGLPIAAELIVGRALLRVFQYLVGLADLFEPGLGVLLLAHVGVVFARELAIAALDLVLRRIAGHAQDFVIVLVFHIFSSAAVTLTSIASTTAIEKDDRTDRRTPASPVCTSN